MITAALQSPILGEPAARKLLLQLKECSWKNNTNRRNVFPAIATDNRFLASSTSLVLDSPAHYRQQVATH